MIPPSTSTPLLPLSASHGSTRTVRGGARPRRVVSRGLVPRDVKEALGSIPSFKVASVSHRDHALAQQMLALSREGLDLGPMSSQPLVPPPGEDAAGCSLYHPNSRPGSASSAVSGTWRPSSSASSASSRPGPGHRGGGSAGATRGGTAGAQGGGAPRVHPVVLESQVLLNLPGRIVTALACPSREAHRGASAPGSALGGVGGLRGGRMPPPRLASASSSSSSSSSFSASSAASSSAAATAPAAAWSQCLYLLDGGRGELCRVDIASHDVEVLLRGLTCPSELVCEGGKLYWIEQGWGEGWQHDGKISVMDLDSGVSSTLVGSLYRPRSLLVTSAHDVVFVDAEPGLPGDARGIMSRGGGRGGGQRRRDGRGRDGRQGGGRSGRKGRNGNNRDGDGQYHSRRDGRADSRPGSPSRRGPGGSTRRAHSPTRSSGGVGINAGLDSSDWLDDARSVVSGGTAAMYEDRGGGLAPRQLTAMRCAAELDSNAGGGEDDRGDRDDRDGSSDEEEEMDTRGLGGAFDRWYVRVLPAQAVSTAVMGPNTHLKVRREERERDEGAGGRKLENGRTPL